MHTRSLRARIFILAAASIIVTLAAAGVMLVVIFEQHVLRRVAFDLDIRSLELAKAFVADQEGKAILYHELADPRYQKPYSGAYWQINLGDQIMLRSRSLWDEALNTAAIPAETRAAGAFEMDGPNKAELYVVERPVSIGSGADARTFQLIVALDHEEVRETRGAFSMDVAKILATLALLLIVGVYLQWRFGLLPLKSLRHKLNAVRNGHSRRLEPPFPTEIAPLASELNSLLDRQDALVRKARDRAGSLAHGLKTPLTILFREARRLEKIGQTESAALLRDQLTAMRAHVERDLARARTHGAVDAAAFRTEILPILKRLIDLMQRMDNNAALQWDIAIPDGTYAEIETSDFAEIAGNLIDNARKWARSRVRIETQQHGDVTVFSVSDDGPGVADNLIGSIVQRGVHAGRGAKDATGMDSTGLGLAIVKDTLAEYGAVVSLENTHGGLKVSFPVTGLRPPESHTTEQPSALPLAAE